MFPLSDDLHPRSGAQRPWVTIGLVTLSSGVFLGSLLYGLHESIIAYGFIPERFLAGEGGATIITALFLHAGVAHLLGNMWFLWIFGDNVELEMGWVRYLVFYVLAGVVSIVVFLPFAGDPTIPLVGASGAISGVLGAYARLFPRNRIRGLFIFVVFVQILTVPVLLYVGFWFLYQILLVGSVTPIAYMAHIGGFLFGVSVAPWFVRRSDSTVYYGHYIPPKT